MKITPELLKRYQMGQCTSEEKREVEHWLDDPEYEPIQTSRDISEGMADSIWKSLAGKIDKSRNRDGIYKQLRLYAAAACVAIGFFSLGYSQGDIAVISELISAPMEATSSPDELVYLSSHPDNTKKVATDKFEVEFDGIIRLYNNSHKIKEIVCGGKKLMLPPGQVSFIMNTKTQGVQQVNIKTGELLFYDDNIKKSTLRICV